MAIQYLEDSFVPHFSKQEMASMKNFLSLDLPNFEFDPTYAEHIEKFHGGRPVNKFFRTRSGSYRSIDRFLNYADIRLLTDSNLKGLNANAMWSLVEDRLNAYLLPFAVLANGDLLCFNYENGAPPSVVLWDHELSEEDAPHVEIVAKDFNELVQILSFNPE